MKSVLFCLFFSGLIACGAADEGFNVQEVLGVPEGTKEGTGLSGEFTGIYKIKSTTCSDFPSLGAPAKGASVVVNLTVTQEGGALTIENLVTTLRGGVNFDNKYVVGGARTISVEGEENILQALKLDGVYQDPNNFTGTGIVQYTGRISGVDVECKYSMDLSAIRKGTEEDT